MSGKVAKSDVLSVFCDSIAVMLSAGIQTDEAVHMFSEDMKNPRFKDVCNQLYRSLIGGSSLADAMGRTGAFPKYAVDMIATGERSGRLEQVLRSLAVYYDEEDRLFSKIRSAVGYPAALLCIMSIILAFTVAVILPVFGDIYENIAGSLTTGSFNAVGVSLAIGWVALVVVLVLTIIALAFAIMSRSAGGRNALMGILERLPFTKSALFDLAFSRFITCLSVYVASGIDTDSAMYEALQTVTHRRMRKQVRQAYDLMIDIENPRSLAQAISETSMLEPVYARMLSIGSRAGSLERTLERLADIFFEEAIERIDAVVDGIEPALAALMTIAVGATLISVMLPLIGVMTSIG